MAVGALEPQFYNIFLKGLGIDQASIPQQMERDKWPQLRTIFKDIFETKTQEEWIKIFNNTDSCVTPVVEYSESQSHPQNQYRKVLAQSETCSFTPAPAPKLSRTPAQVQFNKQNTESILVSMGLSLEDINYIFAKSLKAAL